MRRTTSPLCLALAVLVAWGLTTPVRSAWAGPGGRPADTASTLSDGYGIHVTAERQLDPRLLAVTVTTSALPGAANIRVLLPSGYAAHPARRYPVLYLLHGTSGGASDWTTMGDAERTTAGLPVIVVMPDIALDDGGGGWCTNWYNGGAYGRPEWETFHISELIPWVDHDLRTIGSRQGRAIAGLSQGGFCSMSYAARHPDLFSTALAYSGAPDIAWDPDANVGSTVIVNGTEVGLDHVPPNSMFGDRVTQEVNWADHDPATLAENLKGTDLFMYFGNGDPGPLDQSPVNPEASGIEALVARDNIDFHARLDSLGLPSFYDAYGPGTHSWPYWARDLQQSIAPIMDDFAHPPTPPSRVTYTIADERYSIYGWDVTMQRPATEFSTLEDADAGGFALAGSGSGSVATPASYRPGARYAVMLSGDKVAPTMVTRVADANGRLHLQVPLGPGNPFQQDTAPAMVAGTKVYTTTVRIKAL
jgi:S-formylglutathione hydrolase FrmB